MMFILKFETILLFTLGSAMVTTSPKAVVQHFKADTKFTDDNKTAKFKIPLFIIARRLTGLKSE